MTSLSVFKEHVVQQAKIAHALVIIDALRDLEQSRKDADKARIYCGDPKDLNDAEHYEQTARISLHQALSNAGIDPDIVEGV